MVFGYRSVDNETVSCNGELKSKQDGEVISGGYVEANESSFISRRIKLGLQYVMKLTAQTANLPTTVFSVHPM